MERKPLLVKDFMAGNLVTFSPNQNVHDAVKLFVEKKISGGPVNPQEIVPFLEWPFLYTHVRFE